ncbi:MAG: histidine triad nucleotide-binding protein [Candidatus Jacksonbacteria bacterium]|nr:histidine triad nucleotide-binding protein [Candidatus Jacksonbacteria bacterium]
MSDCIFCKIVNKEIPSEFLLEDDSLVAFKDIDPKASTHVLIVPKKHISKVSDSESEDAGLLGVLLLASKKIAEKIGILESGYRIIINSGADAGQEVDHLHVHVLGGEKLGGLNG